MSVAIYARTSTDRQQGGLESQKRALVEYCNLKGVKDFSIYEDFGVSGMKSRRPELDRLMRDVRSGTVKSVVVYSFSRFARSTKFLIDSLEEFNSLGVNFVSLSESVDLSSPMGKAMFTIISAIANLERDLISERVKLGLKNARANGKNIGRPKLSNDELIVSLRKKGYTYRQIRKFLGVGNATITRALKFSDC